MPWEAWATLVTILIMTVALMRNLGGPDTVLFAGLTLLITLGLFAGTDADGNVLLPSAKEAVMGFGNEGLITIGILFILAEGLRQTGAMSLITQPLLGMPKNVLVAQTRMMLPVAAFSGFLNNTPIVAMFMPVVSDLCKKTGLSPSKLLMPLSFAAIMGGTCTLIGTSTNLVVNGLIIDAQSAGELAGIEMGMFTISLVGVPATIIGLIYVLALSRKLLPDRREPIADMDDSRRYTVEMMVESGSAIDGKSIEQAGLRHLDGMFLAEIERDGERIVAVGPEQILHGNDRVIFVGVVESVVDIQRIRGLIPATDQVFKLDEPRPNRQLVEAVVSGSCPLIGKTIRDGRFRTLYNAVVIAVHRGGEHLNQKIGDIVLQPGDTLLMETSPWFVHRQRNRRDFYLVSAVEGSKPVLHERAWIALAIMLAMVLGVTFTSMSLLNGALLAVALMVMTRCIGTPEARGAVEWRVLIAIGSAIGIGKALDVSGADVAIAEGLLRIFEPMGDYGVLAGIYLVAMIFNMMIGNIGSAVLVFPIAKAVAETQHLEFMPFAIAIMMASSASYATPISYPTNLMVYGPGGYKYSDYMKLGLPLNFVMMAVVVALAPVFWPFHLAAQ